MKRIIYFFNKNFWYDVLFWAISGVLSIVPILIKIVIEFFTNTYVSGNFFEYVFNTNDGSYFFVVLTMITLLDYYRKVKKDKEKLNGIICFFHFASTTIGILKTGIYCTLVEENLKISLSNDNIIQFNIYFAIFIAILDIITYIYINFDKNKFTREI